MKRNNDRVLLESLVNKYGKTKIVKAINEMNTGKRTTLKEYLSWYFGTKNIREMYDLFMSMDFDPYTLEEYFDNDYDAMWNFLKAHLNDEITVINGDDYDNYLEHCFTVDGIEFVVASINEY